MKKSYQITIISMFIIALIACGKKSNSGKSSDSSKNSDKKIMFISAIGGLNGRTTPSLQGKRIITIPEGSKVTVTATHGDTITLAKRKGKWTQVKYKGKKYWVFGGFLSKKISKISASLVKRLAAKKYGKKPHEVTVTLFGKNMFHVSYKGPTPPAGMMGTLKKLWGMNKGEVDELIDLTGYSIKQAFINNDTLMDIVTEGGCCGTTAIQVYLGQNDGSLKNVFAANSFAGSSNTPELVSNGKCKNFVIKSFDQQNKQQIHYYDCAKDLMVLKQ